MHYGIEPLPCLGRSPARLPLRLHYQTTYEMTSGTSRLNASRRQVAHILQQMHGQSPSSCGISSATAPSPSRDHPHGFTNHRASSPSQNAYTSSTTSNHRREHHVTNQDSSYYDRNSQCSYFPAPSRTDAGFAQPSIELPVSAEGAEEYEPFQHHHHHLIPSQNQQQVCKAHIDEALGQMNYRGEDLSETEDANSRERGNFRRPMPLLIRQSPGVENDITNIMGKTGERNSKINIAHIQ